MGELRRSAAEYELAAHAHVLQSRPARAGYRRAGGLREGGPSLPKDGERLAGRRRRPTPRSGMRTLPGEYQVPGVLTRTARGLFDGGTSRAESIAQRSWRSDRDHAEQQRVAWTVLAHTWFDGATVCRRRASIRELARDSDRGSATHGRGRAAWLLPCTGRASHTGRGQHRRRGQRAWSATLYPTRGSDPRPSSMQPTLSSTPSRGIARR